MVKYFYIALFFLSTCVVFAKEGSDSKYNLFMLIAYKNSIATYNAEFVDYKSCKAVADSYREAYKLTTVIYVFQADCKPQKAEEN